MDPHFVQKLQSHAESHSKTNSMMEVDVADEAKILVKAFRDTRRERQEAAQAEENRRAAGAHVKPKRYWCGLLPFARYRKGAFELGWKEIRISNRTKKVVYQDPPRRNDNGDYDLKDLRARCHEFEWELVLECEREAALLRAYWRQVIAVRAVVRVLSKKAQANPAPTA